MFRRVPVRRTLSSVLPSHIGSATVAAAAVGIGARRHQHLRATLIRRQSQFGDEVGWEQDPPLSGGGYEDDVDAPSAVPQVAAVSSSGYGDEDAFAPAPASSQPYTSSASYGDGDEITDEHQAPRSAVSSSSRKFATAAAEQEEMEEEAKAFSMSASSPSSSTAAFPSADGSASTLVHTSRSALRRKQQQQQEEQPAEEPEAEADDADAAATQPDAAFKLDDLDTVLPPSSTVNEEARRLAALLQAAVANYTPGPDTAALASLLAECKNGNDLNRIVEELIKPNPGMHDLVNGHGFRVFVFGKVAAASAKLGDTGPWLRLMRLVRSRGFKLTRTYIAYFLETLRKETSQRFAREGRNPAIAGDAVSACRTVCRFAEEDGVVFDWVLMSRVLFVVTGVVAVFDRQNVYRSNWPSSGELPRREGIVPEWVIAHERPADYDRVIQLCDGVVDDLVLDVRNRFRCRPPFSFVMRLADYYFATDNPDRMLATMEDALESGVPIGESSTAKLLQIVCAFNLPEAPRVFLKFRVMQPQCMLVAPDFSRLLMYYCRSGGGLPCPLCGDRYNHRNVSLAHWRDRNATTERVRACPLLEAARSRRGELENDRRAPQCRDWSVPAMRMYELSVARAIVWGPVEWRAFVMCHMFSPRDKALAALALVESSYDRQSWDEFLAAQVMRLLRHQAPERIVPTLRSWHAFLSGTGDEDDRDFTRSPKTHPGVALGTAFSPLVVQEAAMGVVMLDDGATRVAGLRYLVDAARACEIYTMPYTERVLAARLEQLQQNGATASGEEETFVAFCGIVPRSLETADFKDSCSDIKPAPNSKRSVVWGSR